MSLFTRRFGFGLGVGLSAVVLHAGLVQVAVAQQSAPAPSSDSADWLKKLSIDPESSAAKKYAQQQKARVAAEKQLKKIRAKYFGTMKNAALRQEGLLKLADFTDPALFSSMVTIFKHEDMDVRTALMDTFKDSKTGEGDTALTWIGVFDDNSEVRSGAISRLKDRIKQEGQTPETVKLVCYEGIRSGKTTAMASAAQLANNLDIIDAIPWLIAGQIQGGPAGGGGAGVGNTDRDGALAWIMVGTQTAFVSDLTPVVGPSAVAFDPQLSVVTEGVLLRVFDAVVITYNVDLSNALIDMSTRNWGGQSTKGLGWNTPAWKQWYAKEFLPFQAEKQAKAAVAQAPKASAPAVPAGTK